MQTVTVSRSIDTSASELRAAIQDVQSFMQAAGFDSVTVEGNTINVSNQVGITEIELTLRAVDDPDYALVYEQADGIFKEMRTTYTLSKSPDATTITATTDFEVDVAVIGEFLDTTIINRQRKHELNAQLDYLQDRVIY